MRQKYEMNLSQNWLPLIPRSMATFPQPQITRGFSYGLNESTVSSQAEIPLDKIMKVSRGQQLLKKNAQKSVGILA